MTATNRHLTRSLVAFVLIALLVALLPGMGSMAAPAQSAGEFVPNHVLVRFRAGTPAALKLEARQEVGGELLRSYTLVPDLELLGLAGDGMGVQRAVEKLSQLSFVQYAEPDYIVHASVTPNDPQYGNLWGMTNIHAPAAWDVYTGDANLVVAIIDTGIDYNHQDLAANIWTNPGEVANNGIDDDGNGYVDDIHGWDWAYGDNNPLDVHGHGSHTGGTVGAVGNNGVGVVGVNWNIKLMALKFLNDSGSGSTSNAVSALNYAVNKGVKVSNNSWGGGSYSQSLYDAIENSKSVGHLFVAAAGNNGTNNDTSAHYPSSYNNDNLIAVAAIDVNDNKASFSNYGATSVDLGAPGVSILSTTPNNNYSYYDGTSMATPHVAGTAALLYGAHPDWTYAQVRDRIFNTARPIAALSGKTVTGGTLDAGAALSGATPPPTATPTPAPPTPTPTPAPSNSMHVGDLDGSASNLTSKQWRASVTITVHDSNENPVSGATVQGSWSNGASGSTSCTTNSSGQCTVSKNLSRSRVSSVTWSVSNVTKSGMTYNSSANHDVDGGTNGSTITVYRP